MLCQVCNKTDATLRITRLVHGSVEELHVCEECAIRTSPYHAKLAKKRQKEKLSVENLLKDLLEKNDPGTTAEKGVVIPVDFVKTSTSCPSCGLEFRVYKQTFMLGCPDCYDSFGERLAADIERIHGTTEHHGGPPPESTLMQDIQSRLRDLRSELEDSVADEDFERAAQIRDAIRKVQEEAEEKK